MVSKNIQKVLRGQHYGLFGKNNHSAVQICLWTRRSLNGQGVCWKEKFYGIKSHRCCQMTPAVMYCQNKCLHCWRAIEYNLGKKIQRIDEPKEILEGAIEARKKLLSGFKGNKNVSIKKFKESLEPTLFTFSLSGEPTLYPRLSELISLVRKRKAISFLVTNGLNPKAIKKLEKEKSLPTQITLSTNAPNKELFNIWHNSSEKDAWKKFNETLLILNQLKGKTRRVIRLTLVKETKGKKFIDELTNMNDEHIREYAKLIKKANPDFIHVKGYTAIGFAKKRMGYEKEPWHHEIKVFSQKLVKELNNKKLYKILGEDEKSRVVLLGKNKKMMKIKEPY